MPREATGTVAWMKGRWHARLTVKDKAGKTRRPWVDLQRPDIPNTPEGRGEAKRLATEYADLVRAQGGVWVDPEEVAKPEPGSTVAKLVERWLGLLDEDPGESSPATIHNHKTRANAHVVPELGPLVPPLEVPQLRAFFRELKAKRSGSTTRNVANTLTKFLDDIESEGWATQPVNPMRDRKVREVLPTDPPEATGTPRSGEGRTK
jgi:hypothetical protein